MISEAVRVNMPSSRTHECRYCVWQQVMPGLGVVVIFEGRTPDRAKQTGRYLVREHEPTYCRRFEVVKPVDKGGTTYWVSVGDDGVTCDCEGFTAHSICKHSDAIRELIRSGSFQ